MVTIWNWLRPNLSSLVQLLSLFFTIVGVGATVYFAISRTSDLQQEVTKRINESLVTSVQELAYSEQSLSLGEIETMIKGLELRDFVRYEHSTTELIVQAQERFLSNKFLPVDERKRIYSKLEQIRIDSEIQREVVDDADSSIIFSLFVPILSGGIALFAGLLGVWGFFLNANKARRVEAADVVNEKSEEIESRISGRLNFERVVKDILMELRPHLIIDPIGGDLGYDFQVDTNDNSYLIETKFSSSDRRIPSMVIRQMTDLSQRFDKNVILITNQPLTARARRTLDRFNSEQSERSLIPIVTKDRSEISTQLANIFR